MIHIAVLMMVKNEHKRIHVTLESIKNIANSLIIYDTGSTDNTIEILEKFCKDNNIPLRLKIGEFVDFSTSRNISLDFAYTFKDVDYILLLDTNDELRGDKIIKKYAKKYQNTDKTGFLLPQVWWSGQYDRYFNLRFIKPNCNWKYVGKVHEYMTNDNEDKFTVKIDDKELMIYQDRTQDDDKSCKRFYRDKELLLAEYFINPKETRTVFYLAQTCSCLGQLDEAFYYYKLRSKLEGFWEEKFFAYYKCGELSENLGHPWKESLGWYMESFEICERVEPIIKIAEYYKNKKCWKLAYTFIDMACKLNYPEHCILFVDKLAYDYKRWHLMGIIAFYCNEYNQGKQACQKAITNGHNIELDKHNLTFYLTKN